MITCKDILKLNLDGVELVAGENGLDRVVSWTYLCQTRPYEDHMSRGNFALIVVDYSMAGPRNIRSSNSSATGQGLPFGTISKKRLALSCCVSSSELAM